MEILPTLEKNYLSDRDLKASVIWLHGLGADGNDFAPIVPQLNLSLDFGVRFIFPHAPAIPVTINSGYVMPAWYDIKQVDVDRHVDNEQLQESASRIHDLIDREIERGIQSTRIIVAGFSQIFKKSILKKSKVILNLHAGKIPQYRGGSPLNWQIINNEKYFGLSILKVEKGIDTGPIYLQKKYLLKSKFTIKDLHKKANIEFSHMINYVLLNINKIKPLNQKKSNSKYWKQRNDLDGKIDFNNFTGFKIHRLNRALQDPYPHVWCLNNKNIKVRFQKLSLTNKKVPGTFGSIKYISNKLFLRCRYKNLIINKYKIEKSKKKLFDKEILK